MFTGFLRSCDKSPSGRFIAGYRGISALCFGLLALGIQVDLMNTQRQVLTVVISVHHHFGIRCNESRFLLELILKQMNRFVHRLVKQPAYKTQRKHIPALEDRFIIKAGFLQ